MKKNISITAVLFNLIVGLFIGFICTGSGDIAALCAGGNVLAGFIPRPANALFVGLNKEVWIDKLMEDFYADSGFLVESEDMSEFVDNDVINLTEIGADPNVLLNNNTFPVTAAQRTDTALTLTLETYDTENTTVRNAEQVELAYDKMASVLKGHKRALRLEGLLRAAHNYAPTATGANTPILKTTGADRGDGLKRAKFEDFMALENYYDDKEWGAAGDGSRILILHPKHKADLQAQDLTMYNRIFDVSTGRAVAYLYGFKVYMYSKTARYHKTTDAKVAYKAAAGANDSFASQAFLKTEVMRADGSLKMFELLNDPYTRADIIGFQRRGLYLPIRNKAIASLMSPAV